MKTKGQGLIECALILVLVAIVIIAAEMVFGPLFEQYWPYLARFLARNWPWAVLIFVLSLLANLCARLIMDKLNRR